MLNLILAKQNKYYNSIISPLQASTDSKLNRKESYKAQRKNYRREKKRVASELLNSLQDPAVIVLADWLKVSKFIPFFLTTTILLRNKYRIKI